MGVAPNRAHPQEPAPRRYSRCGRGVAAIVGLLASLTTSATVTACTAFGINPITPTRVGVTGVWVHKGGAVLVLRSNGTFSGSRLPHFFGDWSGPTPRTGSGTWRIGRAESDAPPGVLLDFTSTHPNITDELLVEDCCGLPLTIYYDRGDPDEGLSGQYQLAKRASG